MEADFDVAVEPLLKIEAGFVDDPNDPGGATNFGITIHTLAAWRKTGVTIDDVKNMKVDEAKAIYKAEWWERLGLFELPQSMATALLIMTVNAEEREIIKCAQRAGGVREADGDLGIHTKAVLKMTDQFQFFVAFIGEIEDYYCDLVVAEPERRLRYLKGWIRRAQHLAILMDHLGPKGNS